MTLLVSKNGCFWPTLAYYLYRAVNYGQTDSDTDLKFYMHVILHVSYHFAKSSVASLNSFEDIACSKKYIQGQFQGLSRPKLKN